MLALDRLIVLNQSFANRPNRSLSTEPAEPAFSSVLQQTFFSSAEGPLGFGHRLRACPQSIGHRSLVGINFLAPLTHL